MVPSQENEISIAYTPWPEKGASTFAKCNPIFKILSPTDLAVNFWQSND